MAVAFRTLTPVTYSTTTTFSPAKPTGTVDDDILEASIYFNGSPGTITPPAGWTEYTGLADDAWGGGNVRFARYYWKRAASEGASWTWSFSSQGVWGIVAAYSGAITTGDPNDVTPVGQHGNDTAPTGASIITVTNNALVVMLTTMYAQNGAWTKPAAMTERGDPEAAGGAADFTKTPAGATGDQVGGVTPSDSWITAMIALKPAAAGPPPPSYVFLRGTR